MQSLYSRVVDLSHPLHSEIPQWPGDPPVAFEDVASLEREGYYLRRVSLGEHTGTHLSAPRAFYSDGATVDMYPPDSLVAPAVVIDLRSKADGNPDYAAGVEDLLGWERAHGKIQPKTLVLAMTGWASRWGNPGSYLGLEPEGGMHFPGFGLAPAEFLVRDRDIAGLGIDTHGIDPGIDSTLATSRFMLERPRLVLANLTNLDQLPPTGSTLVIGILRLKGGSGSPASVTALVP